MKYLVAVSGGVDSVVLLDQLVAKHTADELIVAHVNHGIRPDADDDERFVAGLAAKYGIKFVSTQLHLGPKASEETARAERYGFLFAEAVKYKAVIITAHHGDDVVGSIAINLYRGTGWRGLGVLARSGIERPLLALRKRDIYEYALAHHLEWVEDSTNSSEAILRNRLRPSIVSLSDEIVLKITSLRADQLDLQEKIDREIARLRKGFGENRYPYTVLAPEIASEILRRDIEARTHIRPARPEAQRLLLAIKTAKPGKVFQLEGGARIQFSVRQFVVQAYLK